MSNALDYTISEIWIYPIKSMGGIALESSFVSTRGLEYDRRWMLVDESGRFLSQRSVPEMAFFAVSLQEGGVEVTDRRDPGGSFRVPYLPESQEWMEVSVWDSSFKARLVSAAADAWFSERLKRKTHLVYMSDTVYRKVDEQYASQGEEVSFADGYPILLISRASLDDLNERLTSPVEMIRFRPNLVVSGTQPFEEDGWGEIAVGEVRLKVVKPCSRCVVTTIDPVSGMKGAEPLKTLSGFRKVGNKILFGQNVLVQKEGFVRVGDRMGLK